MWELAAFAGFELAFVLGPGVLAHRALVPRPVGALERLCTGGAMGHALLLLAFMATAALGARDLLFLYPPAVVLAAGAAIRRHASEGTLAARPFTRRQVAAVVAVAVAALLLLAAASFSQVPMPESKASVTYYPDLVWGMSFAAEALHQWPLTTPQVAGEPLRYHTFAFMEMAATAQVTGIDLPVVVLRLVPASLLLLFVLQLAWAGRRLSGQPWAGPVAAGLVLLVGDLDLGAQRPEPFVGTYFTGLFLSPTLLFGLVFFVAAVVAIRDMLESASRRPSAGGLAVLAVLLFGCAGAKASILPVLLGGLVLYALWRRRVEPGWVAPFALTAIALGLAYVLLYSGGRGASTLGPLQSSLLSLPGRTLEPYADDGVLAAAAVYPIATVVTALAVMLPLVGLAWVVGRGRSLSPPQAWALALLAVSVAAFFVLDLPGVSQFYFLWYGFTAAALVAAGGVVDLARRWRSWPPGAKLAVPLVAVALGAAVTVDGLPLMVLYFALLLTLGGLVVSWAGGLLTREWPAAAAAAALLAAGALDGPLDRLPGLGDRALSATESVHRPAGENGVRGVTRELARGLRWVRDNTDTGAVLAVNNHFLIPAGRDSRFFYYSALAERRVFLESWDYTDRAFEIGQEEVRAGSVPYPRRLALNDAAVAGSASATARLRRRGVTHFLVDLVNGPTFRPAGRAVFRNGALLVYEIPTQGR